MIFLDKGRVLFRWVNVVYLEILNDMPYLVFINSFCLVFSV
jgi:hypothetical protein